MRRTLGAAMLAAALVMAGQPGAYAQDVGPVGYGGPDPEILSGPVPRLPDGTVDLGDGVWTGGGSVGDIAPAIVKDQDNPNGELPLLPWAKELREKRTVEEDPHNFCLPMGIPRTTPFPFRFIQNYTHKAPTHMYILQEGSAHTYRQIFMDGRKHPEFVDPTWLGHSIGWYDGDTLVIDTVGFNDKAWPDRQGTPRTEQLHTVERWTRVDRGHMNLEVLMEDPGAFSRPFKLKFEATMRAEDEIYEYICLENNQFGVAGGHDNPFGQ